MSLCSGRCYQNNGNPFVAEFVYPGDQQILDVGCGAGDNAALISRAFPGAQISGITVSEQEQTNALPFVKNCWLADIETSSLDFLGPRRFDKLIFSHVLEHLRSPEAVLRKFLPFLTPSGSAVIVVPNAAFWKQRIKFAAGDIRYEEGGIMDRTHLRFFTYRNIEEILNLAAHPGIEVIKKRAQGALGLGFLRRILPAKFCAALDQWGVSAWPNLFGYQIGLELRFKNPAKT